MDENSQLIKIVLFEDPVVVSFQAQLLFRSIQADKNTEAALAILHHTQLLLDGCRTGDEKRYRLVTVGRHAFII